MKKIDSYIEELLIRTDCVIVPDLGGFILQRQSAKIVEQRLLPPRTTIGFNVQLTHNDGLLTHEYALDNGISYQAAAEEIAQQVATLHQILQTQGAVLVGKIGTLHRNTSGQLEFSPAATDFLPDNLGLTPIYLPTRTEKPKQIVVTLPSQRQFLRYVATFAIGLAFWCISPRVEEPSGSDYASLNPINWATILSEREAAKVDTVADMAAECIETVEVKQETYKYHLIVAALDLPAAENYCQQLNANGFAHAHILPYKNKLYRVAIQSFRSKKEAITQMEQLRKSSTEYKRAWVYCE